MYKIKMMLTLKDISVEFKENKRGYGKALIYHLIPYLRVNTPGRYIVKMLKNEYDIEITTNELYVYKNRYYKELMGTSNLGIEVEPKKETPLQEINKKDSRTDYQKLRDSLELLDLNSAEEIIRRENEKNEKLKNLLKRKKD